MTDQLLDIRDLAVSFGGLKVMEGVSLNVRAGAISALIGPNGAGKTTIMNVISGHVRAASGSVVFDGTELTTASARIRPRLGIARTFQHSELFDQLTVLDQLMCGAYARRRGTGFPDILRGPATLRRDRELRDESRALLGRLGIERHAYAIAQSLPGALKQLVDLGRALMCEPRLLLLDEIAAGTAVNERELIIEIIRDYRERTGMALLVIEHDLEFIRELAATVIVLANGGVLATGPTDEVLSRQDVLEAYVGAADD